MEEEGGKRKSVKLIGCKFLRLAWRQITGKQRMWREGGARCEDERREVRRKEEMENLTDAKTKV